MHRRTSFLEERGVAPSAPAINDPSGVRFGGRLERRSTGVPVAELAGLADARRLAVGGWRSVRHFLMSDAREVSLRTGVPESRVRALQDVGGLRRVHGLGARGVECLVSVGVVTAPLLAASDPDALGARLRDRLGPEAPPPARVRAWVVAARALTGR